MPTAFDGRGPIVRALVQLALSSARHPGTVAHGVTALAGSDVARHSLGSNGGESGLHRLVANG